MAKFFYFNGLAYGTICPKCGNRITSLSCVQCGFDLKRNKISFLWDSSDKNISALVKYIQDEDKKILEAEEAQRQREAEQEAQRRRDSKAWSEAERKAETIAIKRHENDKKRKRCVRRVEFALGVNYIGSIYLIVLLFWKGTNPLFDDPWYIHDVIIYALYCLYYCYTPFRIWESAEWFCGIWGAWKWNRWKVVDKILTTCIRVSIPIQIIKIVAIIYSDNILRLNLIFCLHFILSLSLLVKPIKDYLKYLGLDSKNGKVKRVALNIVTSVLYLSLATLLFLGVKDRINALDIVQDIEAADIVDMATDVLDTDEKDTANNTTNTDTEEADTYYEMGRAYLYGLDGQEIDCEAAYNNFENALELGKKDANFYLGLLCDDFYSYPELDYEKAVAYYEAAGEENLHAQFALGVMYYDGKGVERDIAKAQEMFEAVISAGCADGYNGIGMMAYDDRDYETALKDFNKVVKESEEQVFIADAMCSVAEVYYHRGTGLSYNQRVMERYAKALEWYEKAAYLGNAEAMNNIGKIYETGLTVEKDYEKALEWYEKAADLGNAEAMFNIGAMERDDYEKAMKWYKKAKERYEKAADLGDTSAMVFIGDIYRDDKYVEKDYAKALEWYEKAVDLGNAEAMLKIGSMYRDDEYVEKDYAKALEWYTKAADSGSVSAMKIVANMYEQGEYVEQDYKEAMKWYEKAADSGDSITMFRIGAYYERGIFVERDLDKAQEWYDKVVDSGDVDVMNYLGTIYRNVEQDPGKALEWYQNAADLGNAEAMRYIGDMYENGLGVEQDLDKAQEWYDKAEAAEMQ